MNELPGGPLATRPLHFIWIVDCSQSMSDDGKIRELNNAIRNVIPEMQKEADDNPYADVLVRAIKFSDGATWHVPTPTKVKDLKWDDLPAGGKTDMGLALRMVARELKVPPMSERALPPVLVLISDGRPTDKFDAGLKALLEQPWGNKAVRIAIAIGRDADEKTLKKFANPGLEVLRANNPENLVRFIKWVSTTVMKTVSSPPSANSKETNRVKVNVNINLIEIIKYLANVALANIIGIVIDDIW